VARTSEAILPAGLRNGAVELGPKSRNRSQHLSVQVPKEYFGLSRWLFCNLAKHLSSENYSYVVSTR
jgi:hypothetical protein